MKKRLSHHEIIKALDLQPLPEEGGFFKRTFESATRIEIFNEKARPASSSIYYLITADNFSALHMLRVEETYHHYLGDSVDLFLIFQDGSSKISTLGKEILLGERPQIHVPSDTWQGCRIKQKIGWSLLGTTVSPGFEFSDFKLGYRETLSNLYPALSDQIIKLTRG